MRKTREVPAIWAEVDEEEARGERLLAWQNEGFPHFAAPPPPPRHLPRQRQDEGREREEEKGRIQTAPHQTSRQERKEEIKQ